MFRVLHCAIRGPEVIWSWWTECFSKFCSGTCEQSVMGLRAGLDCMEMKIINILSLLVI